MTFVGRDAGRAAAFDGVAARAGAGALPVRSASSLGRDSVPDGDPSRSGAAGGRAPSRFFSAFGRGFGLVLGLGLGVLAAVGTFPAAVGAFAPAAVGAFAPAAVGALLAAI